MSWALSRRELTAAAIAPLVAPLGYWLALTVYGFARWLAQHEQSGLAFPSLGELARPLGLILLVGAPVAWVAALAGIPIYLAVRGADRLLDWRRRGALLVIGTAIGLLVALLMEPGLRGELVSIPFPPWLGAILGAAVVGTFLRLLAR